MIILFERYVHSNRAFLSISLHDCYLFKCKNQKQMYNAKRNIGQICSRTSRLKIFMKCNNLKVSCSVIIWKRNHIQFENLIKIKHFTVNTVRHRETIAIVKVLRIQILMCGSSEKCLIMKTMFIIASAHKDRYGKIPNQAN